MMTKDQHIEALAKTLTLNYDMPEGIDFKPTVIESHDEGAVVSLALKKT
jgi:hypothetical protein